MCMSVTLQEYIDGAVRTQHMRLQAIDRETIMPIHIMWPGIEAQQGLWKGKS